MDIDRAGINKKENMKIEIINLDRIRIQGRGEKRRVGMRKQTILNVDMREIIPEIITVERQKH